MHQFTQTIIELIVQYGSVMLFMLLAVGIVGLPIPDETLMIVAGFLVSTGKLLALPTFLAAFGGSICGISVSYILGRTAGFHVLRKFGGKIGITEPKLNRVHSWFERIGKWTLPVGYFVPGVRHLTGYVAGTVRLHYSIFALFAYSGALIWATTFLSLGYFFGNKAQYLLQQVDKEVWIGIFLIIGLLLLIYLIKIIWRRRKKKVIYKI